MMEGKETQNHYYITGDCHGDFKKVEFFCRQHDTSKKDYMIILGDAGVNFWLNKQDTKLKRRLCELPISFFMIHGNHEQRPSCIKSYGEMQWNGGTVYFEEEFPGLLFAKDGEIYDFDGKKGIAIGGAYSIDKEYRLSRGLPWYETEQPSAEIKAYVEEQLKMQNWKVDYVFSHTCPLFMEPRELFLDFIDQQGVDKSTEEWLISIHSRLHYEKWYFGHFHGNKQFASMEMLYEEIRELGAKDFLQRVGRPLYRQNEQVMFFDDQGEYRVGRIAVVDSYGTIEQNREVSYDIEVANNRLFKHVPESWVERMDS